MEREVAESITIHKLAFIKQRGYHKINAMTGKYSIINPRVRITFEDRNRDPPGFASFFGLVTFNPPPKDGLVAAKNVAFNAIQHCVSRRPCGPASVLLFPMGPVA